MEIWIVKLKIFGGMVIMEQNNELSFEAALEKLETIVKLLEEEDLPLEKSISYYEEGMKLTKLCDDMLKNAQEKLTYILKDNEDVEPFEIKEE